MRLPCHVGVKIPIPLLDMGCCEMYFYDCPRCMTLLAASSFSLATEMAARHDSACRTLTLREVQHEKGEAR